MSNSMTSDRSTLKEFLASIATIQGDLSNITAPPFVLGEHSTVELPQYWADHPNLFVAPALAKSAEERALRVLKWFLGSLKNQQYAGRDPADGVKKPLNAFLGELFLGSWRDDEVGETRLVSEQVSHHPPVTACYLWNEKHGIRAEGFTCQEITFSGSVSIKQKGYAILHVDEYEEDYLIPVPNVKVKGILGGSPYPELTGTYSIVSSTGYISEIKFEGKGLFSSGKKNGFEARVYHKDEKSNDIFTVAGQWSDTFTIQDAKTGKDVETFDVNAAKSLAISVPDREDQDPWESRRAWGGVIDALGRGDMKTTTQEKSTVEEGQRRMRKEEQARGAEFERVFFRRQNEDAVFSRFSDMVKDDFDVEKDGGIWKIDREAVASAQRPYHGGLSPTGGASETSREMPTENANGAKVQDVAGEGEGASARREPKKEKETQTTDASDERERLERLQVEELLRDKYSSTARG